ncbi:MAG: hypothetical protein ACTSYI_00095, partial [Promethearchaeota archaeon]
EKEYIDLALAEIYPDAVLSWRFLGDNEIYIKFGDSTWGGNTTQFRNKIIAFGKNLTEHLRPVRLVQASMKDISEEISNSAYRGTSWNPENRGISTRADYVAHINSLHDDLYSKVSPEQHSELKDELERYQQNYKNKIVDQLHRHSGIVSTFITGGSNFPARKMEKRNEIYDRKAYDFREWIVRAQKSIKKKFGLIKSNIISSDDVDAIDKIEDRIVKLEKIQDRMKKINRIVRSKKKSEVQKIEELKNFKISPQNAEKLLTPDYMGGVGFPSFELSNNNAKIRRLKLRKVELIKRRSEKMNTEIINGVEIVDNVEDNRLQLFFPSKPTREIIQQLKSKGFRWAPSIGAWQSYRNERAKPRALEIIALYH